MLELCYESHPDLLRKSDPRQAIPIDLRQELASQAHQPSRASSPTQATTLTLHVHLQRHLSSTVHSRLLITRLPT